MIPFILRWFVSGLAVLITSKIVPGFRIEGFVAACFAVVIIGAANAFVWPLLFFFTLPINVLTLGLFTFVINGAILKLSALLVPGFVIDTWFSAIIGSIVLSLVGMALHYVLI